MARILDYHLPNPLMTATTIRIACTPIMMKKSGNTNFHHLLTLTPASPAMIGANAVGQTILESPSIQLIPAELNFINQIHS